MLLVLLLIAVIVLLFYLRKERLEASKDTGDSKDSKDSGDTKDSKDSGDSKDTKDGKETTIIIIDGDSDRRRNNDPFYTMTDPYWATYNYRPSYIPRHFGHPLPLGPRRIW